MKKEKMEGLLRRKGEELKIPKSLEPEQMRETLSNAERKSFRFHLRTHVSGRNLYTMVAAAACFCLVTGIWSYMGQPEDLLLPDRFVSEQASGQAGRQDRKETKGAAVSEVEQVLPESAHRSYEEIYAYLSENWQRKEALSGESEGEGALSAGIEDLAAADAPVSRQKLEASTEAFGKTNTQVEQVDEADQIKNDGRYLYQIAGKEQEENGQYSVQTGIQILDTQGGLKEAAFLDDFESVEEFYVWEDLLITIENKCYDCAAPLSSGAAPSMEKKMVCGDLYMFQGYHEIRIYQIADRSRPVKLKTFTLQGIYESSRVSEGYFYGISRFTAEPGEGEQDYDAYIPSLNGKRMEAEKIYCPEDADGTDYLVLVSIDLSDPTSFADSRAVLTGAGTYYVSTENIYMAQYRSVYGTESAEEGKTEDATGLLRFSFEKGRFYARAQGEVPGNLESCFSMDEYEGNLRVVTTVQEYEVKEIRDDRTGVRLGYDYEESSRTSALYILDSSLTVKGKIEGLAEGEMVRSARFLGETGYFVTFRQTDPLFAADLSDPENPRILSELKVSGFSEYLHFYGASLLLGIGMEADEETGREQGMKLSMFDLSKPEEIKEISRVHLKDYDYSEALNNHRAALVDAEENIIGFEAEGWQTSGCPKDYVVFSWQDGAFVQKQKFDIRLKDGGSCTVRGTFIGDTFYLLFGNGTARAYDLNTGELQEEI